MTDLTVVRVQFTKWGGLPHWAANGVHVLGEDEHGCWLGQAEGTRYERPGLAFDTTGAQVMLLPRDRGFAATFYLPVGGLEHRLYVDITTQPVIFDGVLECVDLDLDVIQRFDGTVFVDDEDEFELHRERYRYPDEVVAAARAECDRVVAEVRSGATHFSEDLAAHWREVLAARG